MEHIPGKRERNKAANRAAILEAGRQCFINHGYDAITVRDIIRATDLATGTFYNYFPDKRSVFAAILEGRMHELTSRLVHIRRNATDMRHFIYNSYYATFETIAVDPVFYQFIARNSSVVLEIFDQSILGLSITALENDIRDAIARGVFPEIDVEYLAAAIFGVAFEIGRTLARRENRDPGPAAEIATQIFLEGIAGPKKTHNYRANA